MYAYSHNYELPARVRELLRVGLADLSNSDFNIAEHRLHDSILLLDKYLSSDNLVEVEELRDGWVRCEECELYQHCITK